MNFQPRWIIPDKEYPGELKLVVSSVRPVDAICEAPHNFTNEMEPYFILHESIDPKTGEAMPVTVTWHKDYIQDLSRRRLRKKGHKIPHPDLPKGMHDVHIGVALKTRKEFHNSMKIHQRFVYSILGDLIHNPKFMPYLKPIFSKDHLNGAALGITIRT
jgi:hypothetical protein